MENVASPRTAKQILEKYGLSPLKKFGQNFLVDDNILRLIADAADIKGGNVLEVGAGLGALTIRLAERARHVLSYEIDHGLFTALQETLAGLSNITLKNGDILKADIEKDAAEAFGGEPFAVAANLPYYITSPCIMRFLEGGLNWSRMVLMVQKEVAQRLCAPPGSEEYGAVTAAVAFFARPSVLFTVSRNCFYPRPDVDSAVVGFTRETWDEKLKGAYLTLVKGLFHMRRKTVMNNMAKGMGCSREEALRILGEAGVAPKSRAETLGRDDFLRMAEALASNFRFTGGA